MPCISEGAKHVLIQGSLLGLLALAAILLLGAAGRADGAAAAPALEEFGILSLGGCCRWELAAVSAQGGIPAGPGLAVATMLLNQCTGHTWILNRGPQGEFEWMELRRLGRWDFRLELE